MSLTRKLAGQIVTFTAVDADGDYVTGDAANITASVIVDGVRQAATNSVAEVDATNAPGRYRLTLTQAETDAANVEVSAISATADVQVLAPALGPTTPPKITRGPLVATGSPTTTTVACDGTGLPTAAGALAGTILWVTTGDAAGLSTNVTSYTNSGGTATFTFAALPVAMAAGDLFEIGGRA